jgi:hypothetical protein
MVLTQSAEMAAMLSERSALELITRAMAALLAAERSSLMAER